MAFDDVDASDGHLVAIGVYRDHFADQTAILSADHLDSIALADVQVALFPQLAPDRAEDAGAARLSVWPQDHCGVLIELYVRAVGAAMLLRGPDDHRLDDLTLLDVAAWNGVLDGCHDDVADPRVPATGSAEHPDAQDLLGTGVVGDLEPRLLLDHLCSFSSSDLSACVVVIATTDADNSVFYLAFSRISTRRQRFVALSGRVSMTRTRSPTAAAFCSSCALSRLVCRKTLPYRRCFT